MDPPYFGRHLYRFNFSESDFVGLEKRLHGLKGKFVLSLNDLAQVRSLFHKFNICEVRMAYSAQQKVGRRYDELLITNFET